MCIPTYMLEDVKRKQAEELDTGQKENVTYRHLKRGKCEGGDVGGQMI